MRRVLSNFALSGWLGFSASHAFLLAAAAVATHPADIVESLSGMRFTLPVADVPADHAGAGAIVLLGVVGAISAALVKLNQRRWSGRAEGERLAAAALAALAALFGSAAIAGSPLGGIVGGAAFAFVLAATFGALLFDHLLDEEEFDGDCAFAEALRSLGASARAGRAEIDRAEETER